MQVQEGTGMNLILYHYLIIMHLIWPDDKEQVFIALCSSKDMISSLFR